MIKGINKEISLRDVKAELENFYKCSKVTTDQVMREKDLLIESSMAQKVEGIHVVGSN